MKARREFIILALIIAALTTYIFLKKRGEIHYVLPELKPIQENEVSKITIRKGERKISIQKKEEAWVILPREFPADRNQVSEMVDSAGSPTLTALASESRNYALYELDQERRIRVELYHGEDLLRTLEIGKTASSFRHTFVKVDEDHRVYHARGDMNTLFDKPPEALRDMTVMAIDEEITGASLAKGEKRIEVVKIPPQAPESHTGQEGEEGEKERSPVTEPTWRTEDGRAVKEQDMEDIISTMRNLRCDSYIEERGKDEFKNPAYTVSLRGTDTYSLSIYGKSGNRYEAVSSGSDYPFLLPEWVAKKFMKDPATLIQEIEGDSS